MNVSNLSTLGSSNEARLSTVLLAMRASPPCQLLLPPAPAPAPAPTPMPKTPFSSAAVVEARASSRCRSPWLQVALVLSSTSMSPASPTFVASTSVIAGAGDDVAVRRSVGTPNDVASTCTELLATLDKEEEAEDEEKEEGNEVDDEEDDADGVIEVEEEDADAVALTRYGATSTGYLALVLVSSQAGVTTGTNEVSAYASPRGVGGKEGSAR